MNDLMLAAEAAYGVWLSFWGSGPEWKDLPHTRRMVWFEIAEAAVKSFTGRKA